MVEVVVSESRGAFSSVKLFQRQSADVSDKIEIIYQDLSSTSNGTVAGHRNNWVQKCLLTFRQIFLPYGFPETVSSDYTTYQIWDTVQAFSSSITGALATEAVMKGVGVGDETATALAATMTWLIKSGSGMIGQIMFAWAKGTALDHDNKKWRMFADVLNDFATFIDLINPLFPSTMTLLVFCFSNTARSLVGVAGGGTRAAIIQHQSRANNSADVSAKDGSQETFVNLVSLLVCLLLLPAVSGKTFLVWSLFAFFTWLHIFSNYRAVKSLQLETFNTSRLLLCLQQYLRNGRVPTIQEVNRDESVIIGIGIKDVDICNFRIRMGLSIEEVLVNSSSNKCLSTQTLENILTKSEGKPFLIIPDVKTKEIKIVLHENISSSDVIEAYVRAVLTAYSLVNDKNFSTNPLDSTITEDWEIFKNIVTAAGFSTSIALLETGDWRAKWKHLK